MYEKIVVALLLILMYQLNMWRISVEKIHNNYYPPYRHSSIYDPIRGAGLTPLTTPPRKSCALLFTSSDREGS